MELTNYDFSSALSMQVDVPFRVQHYKIDSRSCVKGCVFFALAGLQKDGHDFIEEARDKGSLVTIVERKVDVSGIIQIVVPSTLKALHALGRYAVAAINAKVIGITGSFGKTSTKDWIAHLLSGSFVVVKTTGNANTKLTMPLCILEASRATQVLVLEMGASEPGDIQRHVKLAPPDIAVITNIHAHHIEGFLSLEGVAKEKSKLFASSKTRYRICSRQASSFKEVISKLDDKTIVVEEPQAFQHRSIGIAHENFKANHLVMHTHDDKSFPIAPRFFESHFIHNLSMAIEVALLMGVEEKDIQSRIKTLPSVKHRFEKSVIDGVTFIDDAYNAGYESTMQSLKNLPKTYGKTIVVLGSLAELRQYEKKYHQLIAKELINYADMALIMGEGCQYMIPIFQQKRFFYKWVHNIEDVVCQLKESVAEGDTVLLKGSKGHKLWTVIDYIISHDIHFTKSSTSSSFSRSSSLFL